jgi:NAD(P)H dehydrogenase (quinone)
LRTGSGAFAAGRHPYRVKENTMFPSIQSIRNYLMIIVDNPLEASGHYRVACAKMGGEVVNVGKKLRTRLTRLGRKLNTGVEDAA